MFKKIILLIIVLLILIQFIRPSKNKHPGVQANNIETKFPVSPDLKVVLKKACLDCHSNNSEYPWYSKIQPVYWWMTAHIKNGKKHLNFDEFTKRPAWNQYHKFEEIQEMIEKNEMPLSSYTWQHKDAILKQSEKDALINWVNTSKQSMEAHYPKDSLVRPKKSVPKR